VHGADVYFSCKFTGWGLAKHMATVRLFCMDHILSSPGPGLGMAPGAWSGGFLVSVVLGSSGMTLDLNLE
jgi:hypothetical protein